MKAALIVVLALVACVFASVMTTQEQQQSGCSICELAVSVADNYLAQNATQTQIEKKLQSICNLLPEPFSDECNQFVMQYTPQIIAWIEANEDPQEFCTQIGLCTSSLAKVDFVTVVRKSGEAARDM